MTLRRMWLALPFVALLSAGCGTVQNLNPTKDVFVWGAGPGEQNITRVFGGVRVDLEGLSGLGLQDEYAALGLVILAPFYVTDLPFSLVGDTITLPYTALHALRQRIARSGSTEADERPRSISGRGQGFGQGTDVEIVR